METIITAVRFLGAGVVGEQFDALTDMILCKELETGGLDWSANMMPLGAGVMIASWMDANWQASKSPQ